MIKLKKSRERNRTWANKCGTGVINQSALAWLIMHPVRLRYEQRRRKDLMVIVRGHPFTVTDTDNQY